MILIVLLTSALANYVTITKPPSADNQTYSCEGKFFLAKEYKDDKIVMPFRSRVTTLQFRNSDKPQFLVSSFKPIDSAKRIEKRQNVNVWVDASYLKVRLRVYPNDPEDTSEYFADDNEKQWQTVYGYGSPGSNVFADLISGNNMDTEYKTQQYQIAFCDTTKNAFGAIVNRNPYFLRYEKPEKQPVEMWVTERDSCDQPEARACLCRVETKTFSTNEFYCPFLRPDLG